MTGMLRARATWPTTLTDCANSGPRMISAPSSSACWAPSRAASAVPPSSFTRSVILGALNSAIAISAALRIDCPAMPALPPADSGRMRPALTSPVPIVAPGGACALCGGGDGEVKELSRLELPEQPANSVPAVVSKPCRARRRDDRTTDAWRGICADTAVLPHGSLRRRPRLKCPRRIEQRQSVILGANS